MGSGVKLVLGLGLGLRIDRRLGLGLPPARAAAQIEGGSCGREG